MCALRDVGYCRRVRISRQRGRGVLLVGVGVAAAAIGLLAWGAGTLDRLERVSRWTSASRCAVTARHRRDVVVVGVDENTQKTRLGRWPFSREDQATVIDALTAAGAAVIAYDIELATQTDDAGDQAVYAALDASQRVVLATSDYSSDAGPERGLPRRGPVAGRCAGRPRRLSGDPRQRLPARPARRGRPDVVRRRRRPALHRPADPRGGWRRRRAHRLRRRPRDDPQHRLRGRVPRQVRAGRREGARGRRRPDRGDARRHPSDALRRQADGRPRDQRQRDRHLHRGRAPRRRPGLARRPRHRRDGRGRRGGRPARPGVGHDRRRRRPPPSPSWW